MKLSMVAVVGLVTVFLAAKAGATGVTDLFNDGDRATLIVRDDISDDYTYHTLYPDLRASVADGWKAVSLPLVGLNANGTAFDVDRFCMETMRFYLNCKDSRYNDGDDPHFQIDNVKLTKTGLADLMIDNFDDGVLRWSYRQHPSPSSPPEGVAVSIVGGALDVLVTDVDARGFGPNGEMNYIDIFTCLSDDARDSFIYGDDWSAYDTLEFDWQYLGGITRRDYMDLCVRTDNVPEPATLSLLALGGALTFLGRRRRK